MDSGLYRIAPSLPFARLLAEGLLARFGREPVKMATVRVLLPSRRAIRAVREAFRALAAEREQEAIFLPKLLALGEPDALRQEFPGMAAHPDEETPHHLIGTNARILMLSRLLRKWREVAPHAINHANITLLAEALADLLDTLQRHDVPLKALESVVDDDLAEHWQHTLNFLAILRDHWQPLLAEQQWREPVTELHAVSARLARQLRDAPPNFPIVIAGTTASQPSTALLVREVRRLKRGYVVLPGLDTHADDAAWEAIEHDPCHPQHGLAQLLAHCNLKRADVQDWHYETLTPVQSAREAAISAALRPAGAPSGEVMPEIVGKAFEGVTSLACPSLIEEARAIALRLRKSLETPEHTAMLVTHDRVLARQVQSMLERYGIRSDDSGGVPLARRAEGNLLLLLWQAWQERCTPIPLLALLKHPDVWLGYGNRGTVRTLARTLEKRHLRGVRQYNHLDELLHLPRMTPEVQEMLTRLQRAFAPLEALREQPAAPLASWLEAHRNAAESLSRDANDKIHLWDGDSGSQTRELLQELVTGADASDAITASDYAPMLRHFLQRATYRPAYGTEPRLRILSPLEARMQTADLVILAGMNEESWPPRTASDPWLNRAMRQKLGLPALEQEVGLAAHDFTQLLCSGRNVLLTRSLKQGGAATTPSRWWLRLESWSKRQGFAEGLPTEPAWQHWARQLVTPESVQPCLAPLPTPPLEARPRRLHVTPVSLLLADPYGYYAKYILRLRKLDAPDEAPRKLEFGNWLHDVLRVFAERHINNNLPYDGESLRAIGRELLQGGMVPKERNQEIAPAESVAPATTEARSGDRAEVNQLSPIWKLWWPRFEKIADWLVEHEATLPRGRSITECEGNMTLFVRGEEYTLSAIADRFHLGQDGSVLLLDYKTGEPPGAGDIENGFAPQLPLEAIMAGKGGFGKEVKLPNSIEHWKLSGGNPAGEVKPLKDIDALLATTEDGVLRLLAHYHDAAVPYPSEPFSAQGKEPKGKDYRHLARVQEWSA